jgi:hypothetical protein
MEQAEQRVTAPASNKFKSDDVLQSLLPYGAALHV